MSLQQELGLPAPFSRKAHEAMLSIIVTGTLLSKEGERILRPFGLTNAQFNILMLLKYQSKDGKISQTGLSHMLLVRRPNVTGLIDRMEKLGLIRRVADPVDRRVNYIEMTKKGAKIVEKLHSIYYRRLDEVMSVLPEHAYDNLCGYLESIRKNMKGITK
ncbi:MarR family winged helix-turn-helix transcriptional regulator [Candidatus Latescibacterota bacterium]